MPEDINGNIAISHAHNTHNIQYSSLKYMMYCRLVILDFIIHSDTLRRDDAGYYFLFPVENVRNFAYICGMKPIYAKQLVDEATKQMLTDLRGETLHNGCRLDNGRYMTTAQYTRAKICGENSEKDLALMEHFDTLRIKIIEDIEAFREKYKL